VPWSEVRNVTITATSATIETAADSHTIALGRYRNADEIRRALDEWRAARARPRSD
jgi:membrane protein YdbS with pleckstrin-like domain